MRHTTASLEAPPSSKGSKVVTQGLAEAIRQWYCELCTEAEIHESRFKTTNASEDTKVGGL